MSSMRLYLSTKTLKTTNNSTVRKLAVSFAYTHDTESKSCMSYSMIRNRNGTMFFLVFVIEEMVICSIAFQAAQ